MKTQFKKNIDNFEFPTIVLCNNPEEINTLPFFDTEKQYLASKYFENTNFCKVNRLNISIYVYFCKDDIYNWKTLEKLRDMANTIYTKLVEKKDCPKATLFSTLHEENTLAFIEGVFLADYHFDTYKTQKDSQLLSLDIIGKLSSKKYTNLENLCSCVNEAREWVNTPVMNLNAETFANILSNKAKKLGVSATILGQHQIETLKMGGLLGVNRGSTDEARFIILEWNPKNAKNDTPIALVGKGIMYDTGGLNIKTGSYMKDMKSDMAGAATMAATLFAVAENKIPVHIIALIPATDNRLCGNAYAPGDILTMYDGTTVEITNTDAEGRLILADAIAYANQYKPRLIIDAATLTGAAERAIGKFGIVAMEQNATSELTSLENAGFETYERIVKFPFWDEYNDLIKSDVADIKNSSSELYAGMISAGKFLAHFAKAPFVHLDIAGVAFTEKKYSYHGKGATGFGIRMLYNFLKNL